VRIHVDPEADALYLRLSETAIQDTEEVRPGVLLDFDAGGEVVGIEMRHISTRMWPEDLRALHFETA